MVKSTRGQRLTCEEVASIKALFHAGFSAEAIAELRKVAVSTVRYWKNRMPLKNSSGKREKAKKTSTEIVRRRRLAKALAIKTVERHGKKLPAFATARDVSRELARKHGVKVSRWTARRYLRGSGLQPRTRQRVPTVCPKDYETRYRFTEWAKDVDADQIIFTDEKIFTGNDESSCIQWVESMEDMLPRENKRWTTRVMMWAAIGVDYLHWKILPNKRKLKHDDEDDKVLFALTADYYKRVVLPPVVKYCVDENKVFMQDGARVHTAKAVMQYFGNKGVELLEPWPARSPDLNPIETFWAIVAPRVAREYPGTLEELQAAIEKVFTEFRDSVEGMATINRLVRSFSGRCANVHKNKGRFSWARPTSAARNE
jgi:transposase